MTMIFAIGWQVVISVLMNILAVKPLTFGLPFVVCDAGTLISWSTLVCSMYLARKEGEDFAKKVTNTGTIILVLIAVLIKLVTLIPGSGEMVDMFNTVMSCNLRVTVASIAAFWVSNHFTIKIKVYTLGQLIDNTLFTMLAFAGVWGWIDLLSCIGLTTLVEVVFYSLYKGISKIYNNRKGDKK